MGISAVKLFRRSVCEISLWHHCYKFVSVCLSVCVCIRHCEINENGVWLGLEWLYVMCVLFISVYDYVCLS